LRSPEEHTALVQALTDTIDAGGAPGIVYLLRAMSRVTLGDFDNARLDLAEAVDADPKAKPLAQAIEARLKGRAGDKATGHKEMINLLTRAKNDSRVAVLAARSALDRGDTTVAAGHLKAVLTTCPDEAELRLGLAWAYVTSAGA